jgi:hypothetical protein
MSASLKGTNTTTTQQQPPAYLQGAYSNLVGSAQNVAQTPYQPYGGELVAGVNPQETAGINATNAYAGAAQPYINAAAQYATNAATPISAADIARYANPYTSTVAGATEQQLALLNAQQDQSVVGNAVSSGAWGGDRAEVARSLLVGQQAANEAPTLANIESTGYTTGISTAEQQQQAQAMGAYSLGNLGTAAQNAGLSGAAAMTGAGQLQQMTQQQLDAARLQQYYTALAYPYQQLSWLGGLETGVGGVAGGTSQTTGPPPSLISQLAGLGVAGIGAAGLYNATKARGGRVLGFDFGGTVPYSGGINFIPTVPFGHGSGPPKPPTLPGQQQQSPAQMAQGLGSLAKMIPSSGGATATGAGIDAGATAGGAAGGMTADVGAGAEAGFSLADILPFLALARGGGVGPEDIGQGFAGDDGPTLDEYAGLAALGRNSPDAIGPPSTIYGQPGLAALNSGDVIRIPPEDMPQTVSPAAMNRWRTGADADIASTAAPAGETTPLAFSGIGAGAPTALNHEGGVGSSAPATVSAPSTTTAPSGSKWDKLAIPLLTAGFSMLGNRSPYPGVGIGEGALAGIGAYQAQEKETRTAAEKQQTIALEAKKLSDLADYHAKTLKQQAELHGTMTPYQRMEAAKPVVVATNPRTGTNIVGVRDPAHPGQFLDPVTNKPIDLSQYGIKPAAPVTPTFNVPGVDHPVKAEAPAVQVPASPVKTAFGTDDDAALPLRAILNSGETPQGMHPEALDDPDLTPGDKAKVKAIAEGRAAFLPIGRGNKENLFIMNKAYEYNPNLDQTTYARRQRVETYFSVGTQGGGGQQVIALNRFAAHAGSLLGLAEKLDEGQYPTWNSFRNAIARSGLGNKETQDTLGAWDVNAKGVGDEAAKVFAGSNPALADRETWEKILQPNTPLSTIKAKLRQAVEMSEGALGSITAGYNEGMRTNHQPREFLTPQTQAIFDAIKTGKPISDVHSPAASSALPAAPPEIVSQARAAIASGKDRNAVIQRMQQSGYSPTGL